MATQKIRGNTQIIDASIENTQVSTTAGITLSKLAATTANRALASDGSGFIVATAVTDTEIGYVSGVTSAIQTQLGNKINTSEKGVANGLATLDSGGKIPSSQLSVSAMEYQGTWAASTNTPALSDKSTITIQDLTFTADSAGEAGNAITIEYTSGGTAGSEVVGVNGSAISVQIESGVSTATQIKTAIDGSGPAAALVDTVISGTAGNAQTTVSATNLAGTGSVGDVYVASDAGTVDFGAGNIVFATGDWAIYNGTTWEKSSNTNTVSSVNTQTGAVVLDADDISDTSTTNKFVTASDITNLGNLSGTNSGDEVSATETVEGIAELATQVEVDAGTDTSRIVTPATLASTTLTFAPSSHGSNHTDGTDDVADMVGDSGAGGTHGLVPAPGTGDAAANKYLKADGTWATTPAGPTFSDGEIPSGLLNNSNVTYVLAQTPSPATSLVVYLNGIRQRLTTDYSLATATITMTDAPKSGDNIYVDYRY